MKDEARQYNNPGKLFAAHDYILHSAGDYVCDLTHTNTVEGFYDVFKHDVKIIYQYCSKKHLHHYVTDFNFRYSNQVKLGVDDAQRTLTALRGIVAKRLTYRVGVSR